MGKRKMRSYKCFECGGVTEPATSKKEAIFRHFLKKHKHIIIREIYKYHQLKQGEDKK